MRCNGLRRGTPDAPEGRMEGSVLMADLLPPMASPFPASHEKTCQPGHSRRDSLGPLLAKRPGLQAPTAPAPPDRPHAATDIPRRSPVRRSEFRLEFGYTVRRYHPTLPEQDGLSTVLQWPHGPMASLI